MSERGLKQRPDGRWRVSWMFEGKYHRHIVRTKTEARAYLEKIHTQIWEGRYMDKRKETHTPFKEACKRFIEHGRLILRPSTYTQDAYLIKRWRASRFFKGKTIDRITAKDVGLYQAERVAGVSKRMTDYDLSRLRRMFNLCVKWELCKVNPVLKVEFFRADNRRDRFLTEEEEAALLDHADPRIKGAIIFALHTGLRLREMLSLTWENVDPRQGPNAYITITAANSKSKRVRHIPLTESAREVLDGLPRSIRKDGLVFGGFGGSYNSLLRKAWLILNS